MKTLIYFILTLFPFLVNAQNNPGPRITALGSTGVALQDIWSLQSNQAGLAVIQHAKISGAFEKKYFSDELSNQSAVIAFPFGKNVFGLSIQNYGFSAYNEQRIGLAYAKRFGDAVFAALNFNYHQLKIQHYGNAKTFSVEGGIQYKPNPRLCIGTHITNPTQSAYSNDVNATIPINIEFGVSYNFSSKVLLNTGIIKTLNYEADFKAGLEYNLLDWMALRGGVSVNPFRQYAGFGLNYQKFSFDFASASHPNLGYTPQVALSYEF